MDELERQEELNEQPSMQETEGTPEEKETEQQAEEEKESAERMDTAEAGTKEPKKDAKQENNILQIVLGFALLAAMLAFVWMSDVGTVQKIPEKGVLYAKDNALYLYDEKTESYLLQENLSAGGNYHYFYSAWGAEIVDSGNYAYYPLNIEEEGSFSLYRKTLAESISEGDWIADGVYAYQASADGKTAAYITAEGENLILHLYKGDAAKAEVWVVAEGLHLTEDVFTLSEDGKYLIYIDAYGMLCVVETENPMESIKLTDSAELYALAKDALYFVAQGEESYSIYSYAFRGEPAVVAENAAYMELMPNGRDLLYSCVSAEKIPYAELIEDDMAEQDAVLQEGQESYEAKVMRDEIREAMASGEGIDPILQDCYVLTGGRTVKVADHVISAIPAQGERSFVTGYRMEATEKIPLSLVEGGLDMVQYLYYMSLMYGEQQTFLTDTHGNYEILTGYGIQPDSVQISADGKAAAYLMQEPMTGESSLMYMKVGRAEMAEAVQMGVETFGFLGGSQELGYYYDYADGKGSVQTCGEPHTMIAENGVAGVQIAPDVDALYFIQISEAEKGTGQLTCWKEKELSVIDEDVFAFFYHGNGKVVYLKEYDVNTGKGNLFFFDGTNTHLVDTDITAIFRE